MNEAQKRILLKTAKDAVTAAVNRQQPPPVHSDDPALTQKQGCFVTLKNAGRLRGCIGFFTSDKPLIRLVADMAVAAATQDPRFRGDRITPAELPRLNIEVSVLSPLKKTNDPLSLRLGIDGIYIVRGYQSGCFLPQVAEETGWSKEEFLSYCCAHKAGLHPDAWKDPDTEVYLFTADAFHADYPDI
ncbi:MAG TPA: AmmeMemoRadiSam system protein A [Anaerohalosphaeraceae bacterium]|jgi:AmmeMemoRadiSam system protein A|nr:AmmeMemoRadiSam system protein A [Anaerohalosphaeraceae bacterium]HRT49480.1 AmmeMemoRadiSam system protein A [Anaerohalosphaeraceae bacterium]HRT85356.1 AmmeMemoRadiSam system protein A [Anaerohalosphaeraceae bacterium]